MKLRILTGPRRDEDIALPEGGSFTIGRDSGCDLWIDDRKISRTHCTLEFRDGEWRLVDGGSSNGTWVDGDKVDAITLSHGATVTLGDTAFEVFDARVAAHSEAPVGFDSDAMDDEPYDREAVPMRRSRPAKFGSPIGFIVALLAICSVLGFFLTRGDPESEEKSRRRRSASKTESGAPKTGDAEVAAKSDDPKAQLAGGETSEADVDGTDDSEEFETDPDFERKETRRRRSSIEEKIQELREDTLPGLLKRREYKRAISMIEFVVESTPGYHGVKDRAMVLEHADAYFKETLAEIQELAANNRIEDAREIGFDRLLLLPKEVADELSVALHEIESKAARELGEEHFRQRTVANLEVSAWRAIAALDFEAAKQYVQALEADKKFDEERFLAVQRQVVITSAVWASIADGFSSRVGTGTRVNLTFQPERDVIELRTSGGIYPARNLPKRSYKVLAFDGGFLDVQAPKGERIFFDVFGLSDAMLRVRARKKAEGFSANDCDEAVAVLLLLREGPDRAVEFLESTKLNDEAQERVTLLARSHRDLWILERRKLLRNARELVAATKKTVSDDWVRIAARYAEIGRLWSDRNDFASVRSRIVDSYRESRLEQLRRSPPRKTFRAKKVEWSGERLRLSYDFSDDAQFKDVRKVGKLSSIRRRGNSLVLRGEARFFRRNPFTGRLTVRVRLPPGGFSAARPNFSVALWSFPDQPISPKKSMSLTRAMSAEPAVIADYLVFAYGYYYAPFDFGGKPLYQVRPVDGEKYVDLPANTIFVGRHDQSLHQSAGECAWAGDMGKRLTGSLNIKIDAGEGLLNWTINKKSVMSEPTELLSRYVRSIDRLGSISLLSGENEVAISSVEIEGRLDPIWLSDLFQPSVKSELDRLFD